MRYIQNQKSQKENMIKTLLVEALDMVDKKLATMEEISRKEGNQNWKKSKLAVLLLNIKRMIMQILALGAMKPQNPEAQKVWKAKIKELLLTLWSMVKLADNEMQVQRELEKKNERSLAQDLAKKKEHVLTPMERMILQRAQNCR